MEKLPAVTSRHRIAGMRPIAWAVLIASLLVVGLVRVATGAQELTATDTLRAAIEAACPILLAALGGLWAERSGVVNIGLEGQMLLGTWGAAYFNWYYGPWVGLLGGIVLGMIGGIIHAVAVVTFRVDHIISGVAINLIGLGGVGFLAKTYFDGIHPNGGPRNLSGLSSMPDVTIPGLSDALDRLNDQHIPAISDLAGLLAALVTDISSVTIIVAALVVVTWYALWRTGFGLRLRSCGESPAAAESLGVNVYFYKYLATIVSGGFAGLGGAYLTTVSSSTFTVNQSGGRGYIGLAAMIFGNWRPAGTVGASLLFGYSDILDLRSPASLHALLLLVAIILLGFAIWSFLRASRVAVVVSGVGAVAFFVWWLLSDTVPDAVGGMTPYLVTLLVLSFASQRMRPPAADGQPYRKGSAG